MTTPQVSWLRLLWGIGLGTAIGLVADLLHPLHRKVPALSDGLLSLWIVYLWQVLFFDICKGDLRLGCCAGGVAGFGLWHGLVSPRFCPLCERFWRQISGICRFLFIPIRKILKKISEIRKKLYASGEKWVTIQKTKRQQRRGNGGNDSGKLQKDPAGFRESESSAENSGGGGHCIVYDNFDHFTDGTAGSQGGH